MVDGVVCFLGRNVYVSLSDSLAQFTAHQEDRSRLTGAEESHSHSTRATGRLGEWATGRAAAAPARVGSKASNPTADGDTETEAPGIPAGGGSRQQRPRPRSRASQAHSSQQERTVPWGRSLVLVCFWVKSR